MSFFFLIFYLNSAFLLIVIFCIPIENILLILQL